MRLGFFPPINQVLSVVILLSAVVFIAGCDRTSEDTPVTPPLSRPLSREFIAYGVVTIPYAPLLSEPGSDRDSGILRLGTVVRIIERRSETNRANTEIWVFVEGNYEGDNISRGWIQEAVLDLFSNEAQAVTASRSFNQ